MDRLRFSSMSLLYSSTPPRQLHLLKLFSSTPSLIDGSTPLDTYICRELLKLYILGCHDPVLIFLILSRSIRSYSPYEHFLLPLILQPTWFSAFPCFKSLGTCSFSFILHAFHAFRPRFWGFWNFLGFFKIDELLLKFWDGFLLNEFKISCIASH